MEEEAQRIRENSPIDRAEEEEGAATRPRFLGTVRVIPSPAAVVLSPSIGVVPAKVNNNNKNSNKNKNLFKIWRFF
jgi:hypothetical protein